MKTMKIVTAKVTERFPVALGIFMLMKRHWTQKTHYFRQFFVIISGVIL